MSERRLVLIRHAKAGEGAPDEVRALTERGHRDARAIGRWLAEAGIAPDRVVTSPARRARQTWADAAGALQNPPEPAVDDRIYDNSPESLLDLARQSPPETATLVLVGHNPSITLLARVLDDGSGSPQARAEVAAGYPTSGTAVFRVSVAWADLAPGDGHVESFAAPRG